ncbi:uncharacterized protein LOC108670107 [Hyalella azteca]|uniref:Uncharacterized protein LOC108670107 n=1 Tax=Hyalella azteca TaxID=294128 RepID=A0A8B7NI60_HYAAZ|nr:uncharacterized protein LOC108670107 [Hyalella azteca]
MGEDLDRIIWDEELGESERRIIFTEEKGGDLPEYTYDRELSDFQITEDAVRKQLASLEKRNASGPDGISPSLLAEHAEPLAQPITIIFRNSLESGTIARDWRTSNVTPIFKKGSRLLASNYRPVSLTCILCNCMEALVRDQIVDHLQCNSLISRKQHGFTKGRSCVTQLLESLDIWTEALDEGGSIDAVYMDYMKDAQTACSKSGGSWHQGESTPVDDTKVFARSDIPEARKTLQEDLDRLHKWSMDWQLHFHPEKCNLLRLGYTSDTVQYTMRGCNAQGKEYVTLLMERDTEKNLGVVIDRDLSFKGQVVQATAKANRVLGVIRRTFDCITPEIFIQRYKSLVRPMLDYGHSLWQPRHKTLCSDLDDVQRRAAKLIASLKDKPYPERLASLGLPSLEHRRLRGDMIDIFKYVHGAYEADRLQLHLHDGRVTRENSLKLAKGQCRLNVRASYFSYQVVSIWNSLPDNVVTAPSINAFKIRLDKHW